jgi:DnaJ-class molecular chaperone
MAAKKDYYEVLGVKRDASEKEIRQAYRKLARQYHPDVSPNDQTAEARFKEISEANEVLSDKEKRAKYDRYGHDWQHAEQAEAARQAGFGGQGQGPFSYSTSGNPDLNDLFGGGGGGDFSSIFGDLFGGAGGRGGRSRVHYESMPGQDVEHPVTVSLEEAYAGTTRVLSIPQAEGAPRRIEVKIPAGVRDGSRVRVAAEGAPGPFGGPKGDLYLMVTVSPHKTFTREGDDLHVAVPVPLHVAVLGGEVEVPTPKGTKLALRLPAETQNGRKFRLKGQAMPHLGGSGNGDIFAEVQVVLPTQLNDEERKLFERLAELREHAGVTR